ncbi:hypothetical protein E4U42_000692, partial [Claviceps africana]
MQNPDGCESGADWALSRSAPAGIWHPTAPPAGKLMPSDHRAVCLNPATMKDNAEDNSQ